MGGKNINKTNEPTPPTRMSRRLLHKEPLPTSPDADPSFNSSPSPSRPKSVSKTKTKASKVNENTPSHLNSAEEESKENENTSMDDLLDIQRGYIRENQYPAFFDGQYINPALTYNDHSEAIAHVNNLEFENVEIPEEFWQDLEAMGPLPPLDLTGPLPPIQYGMPSGYPLQMDFYDNPGQFIQNEYFADQLEEALAVQGNFVEEDFEEAAAGDEVFSAEMFNPERLAQLKSDAFDEIEELRQFVVAEDPQAFANVVNDSPDSPFSIDDHGSDVDDYASDFNDPDVAVDNNSGALLDTEEQENNPNAKERSVEPAPSTSGVQMSSTPVIDNSAPGDLGLSCNTTVEKVNKELQNMEEQENNPRARENSVESAPSIQGAQMNSTLGINGSADVRSGLSDVNNVEDDISMDLASELSTPAISTQIGETSAPLITNGSRVPMDSTTGINGSVQGDVGLGNNTDAEDDVPMDLDSESSTPVISTQMKEKSTGLTTSGSHVLMDSTVGTNDSAEGEVGLGHNTDAEDDVPMDLDSEPSTPRMNTAAKAPVKDKRKTISLTEYNAMKKTKTNPSTDDTASPTVQKTTGQTTDGIVGWANNITSAVASALGSGKAGGVQQKEGQSSKSSARAAPTPTSHPDWTLPARPSMVVPANFKLNADDWHPDTTPLINQAAMVQKYARDADRAATRLARDTAALEKSKKEGK